jgi:hypothetical protein
VPGCLLKHLLTGVDNQHIVTLSLGRCLDASRFVDRTSLLVNESMNTVTTIINVHEHFVILTTRRVQRIEITIRSILLKSIAQHQTILNNVKFNGVLCVLLGSVVSEGGGHRCLAYEPIIGAYGGVSAPSVPVLGLVHGNQFICLFPARTFGRDGPTYLYRIDLSIFVKFSTNRSIMVAHNNLCTTISKRFC